MRGTPAAQEELFWVREGKKDSVNDKRTGDRRDKSRDNTSKRKKVGGRGRWEAEQEQDTAEGEGRGGKKGRKSQGRQDHPFCGKLDSVPWEL